MERAHGDFPHLPTSEDDGGEASRRSRSARRAVACVVVTAAISAPVDGVLAYQYGQYDAGNIGLETMEQYELAGIGAAILYTLAYVLAAVLFLRWFTLVYRGMPKNEKRYAQWWSWGGWFVPIMSLFRPRQIVSDMWRASADGEQQPGYINAWWGLWIASTWLASIAARLAFRGETVAVLQASAILDLCVDLIDIAGGLLCMKLIADLAARRGELGDAQRQADATAAPGAARTDVSG